MQQSSRNQLVNALVRIAKPPLEAAASGRFFDYYPRHEWEVERRVAGYCEALARTLAGIAPWLAVDTATSSRERQIQEDLLSASLSALSFACSPTHHDHKHFCLLSDGKCHRQFLVEAAYLSLALLRDRGVLFGGLDAKSQSNLIRLLEMSRSVEPIENNWVIFPSIVECALMHVGATVDKDRLLCGIRKTMGWYLGDGVYGDGPWFHFDYYNSYCIQPMLLEALDVAAAGGIMEDAELLYGTALKRAQRYAEILERMISPEGTFPVIGRSSAYRFAAFQLLSLLMLKKKLPASMNIAGSRDGLSAVILRVLNSLGTFDDNGWLNIGAVGHQNVVAESYNGTGSLYVTLCGLLHLGISSDDVFWTSPPQPWTQLTIWNGGRSFLKDGPIGD